jgi:hypothetical protein
MYTHFIAYKLTPEQELAKVTEQEKKMKEGYKEYHEVYYLLMLKALNKRKANLLSKLAEKVSA